jgi:hypothetical protein
MAKLADMILAAMGWTNSHPHAFRIEGARYGVNFDEFPEGEIDESTVTVLQALRGTKRFTFDYDFGDSWEHGVVVEEQSWSRFALKYAVCLDGANACPPEDVGGSSGYGYFLEAIADPSHDEHKNYLDWVGGSFDPTSFNLGDVNALLQKVR